MGLVLSGFVLVVTMNFLLAQPVGGGTPFYQISMAGVSAAVLWGMTLGLRQL